MQPTIARFSYHGFDDDGRPRECEHVGVLPGRPYHRMPPVRSVTVLGVVVRGEGDIVFVVEDDNGVWTSAPEGCIGRMPEVESVVWGSETSGRDAPDPDTVRAREEVETHGQG